MNESDQLDRAGEKLYHTEVWVPESILRQALSLVLKPHWTAHALEQARTDPYGSIPVHHVPLTLVVRDWELVEISALGDQVRQVVIRGVYDEECALVLVVGLRGEQPGHGAVVSCWWNENNDQHKSLDRAKYVPAPKK